MAKSIIEYTPMSGDQTLFSQDDELACVAIALRYVGLREQQVERFASGESALVWLSARIGGLASASICNIAVRDVKVTPQWTEEEKAAGIMPPAGARVKHERWGDGRVVRTKNGSITVEFDDINYGYGFFTSSQLYPVPHEWLPKRPRVMGGDTILLELSVRRDMPVKHINLIQAACRAQRKPLWPMISARNGKKPNAGEWLLLSIPDQRSSFEGEFLGVSVAKEQAWVIRYVNEAGDQVIHTAEPWNCSAIVNPIEMQAMWVADLQAYISERHGSGLTPLLPSGVAETIHKGLLDGSIIMPFKTEGAE